MLYPQKSLSLLLLIILTLFTKEIEYSNLVLPIVLKEYFNTVFRKSTVKLPLYMNSKSIYKSDVAQKSIKQLQK